MILSVGESKLLHMVVHFEQVMLLQRFLFYSSLALSSTISCSCRSELVHKATLLVGISLNVYEMLENCFRLPHHFYE